MESKTKKQDIENVELMNYLAIHDYFEDDSNCEQDEYNEFFHIKIGNFKLSFQRRYQ